MSSRLIRRCFGSCHRTGDRSVNHEFRNRVVGRRPPAIEPRWQLGERLIKEVRTSVEKRRLTPLDGARLISSTSVRSQLGLTNFQAGRMPSHPPGLQMCVAFST